MAGLSGDLGRQVVRPVALPRHAGEKPDHERGHDRQEAVDENGGDDLHLVAAEAHERGREAELHDAEPARRDRDRAEQADERPGGEGLHRAHLAAGDVEHAKRGEQHEEDREVARERGEREHVPPALEERVRPVPEADERLSVPPDRLSADQTLGPRHDPRREVADASARASEC